MTTAEAEFSAEAVGSGASPSRPRWRRPAVWIALWFAAGISLHGAAPLWAAGYCLGAAALSLIAVIVAPIRSLALVLLGMALLLAGISTAQLHHFHAAGPDIRCLIGEQRLLTRIRARIVEPGIVRHVSGKETAAARCEMIGISASGEWTTVCGLANLRVDQPQIPLRPGQEILAIASISRIAAPANPGEYDWQTHFARENVFCRLDASGGTLQLLSDSGEGWLWSARRFVRESLACGFSDQQQHQRALLQTLLFGDNDELLEQTWADFRTSGTAHHLSISGMHIATLSAAVFVLARLLRLHPARAVIVAMIFALCYSAMTRPSPPVIRSVLLCLAVAIALLTARNTDPLQCLAVAILAMLVVSPLDLLNPGFQLSFGTVAGLMLCTRRVEGWLWSFENPHVRMARYIRPPTGFAAMRHRVARASVTAISAGLVAHAVSMPLIAWHFGQLNPWAIPGSMLLAFVVEVSLMAGMFKVIICAVLPAAGPLLAAWAAIPASLMTACVAWLAALPGAQLALPPVPWWLIAAYCALVAAPLMVRFRQSWMLPVAGVIGFALVMAGGLITAGGRDVVATFLSVGNGSCAIVQLPGKCVIVDCGALRQDNLYERTIAPALRALGVRKVSDVIITHEDVDHRSALDDLVSAQSPAVHRRLSRHDNPVAGFDVLAPLSRHAAKGNDDSAVLRLRAGGASILFTGDVQAEGIAALLATHDDLSSTVLVAPHHGSAESNSALLLASVRPKWIVCSSSALESRKQRAFDSIVSGPSLLRTGHCGAITVRISPDGDIDVQPFRHH